MAPRIGWLLLAGLAAAAPVFGCSKECPGDKETPPPCWEDETERWGFPAGAPMRLEDPKNKGCTLKRCACGDAREYVEGPLQACVPTYCTDGTELKSEIEALPTSSDDTASAVGFDQDANGCPQVTDGSGGDSAGGSSGGDDTADGGAGR